MKNIIILLITIVLLTSCTKNEKNYTVKEIDGIKVYKNKNVPSDPTFKITPKKLFTIQGYDENAKDSVRNFLFPHAIAVDSKENIYVMDGKLYEIKKFDRNGNFKRSFGRKGFGPGEFNDAMIVILNDSMYVSDLSTKQFILFDNDGKFIRNLPIKNEHRLSFLTPLNLYKFMSMRQKWEIIEKKWNFTYDLVIRDLKSDKTKILNTISGVYSEDNTGGFDYVTPFCVGKNKIFIAEISTNKYSIDVFDFEGVKKYQIQKDFARIRIPQDDIVDFKESRKKLDGTTTEKGFDIKYKKAIDAMSMFVDKNGYLLVQVPLERNENNQFDFVVDAFKDGVYINRFTIDIGKAYDYFNTDHKRWFIGDRIYYQNREDNCVTVYEY